MPSDEATPIDPVLLALILDRAPDGILLVDSSGLIAFANGHSEALFGYSPDELVGMAVEALVPERFRDRHLGLRGSFQAHSVTRPMGSGLELWALRRDGSEFPVEISLSPMANERGTYVTAIVRDVSARKALEGERQRLRAQAELQSDRERIARDLHDGVMQAIYGVGLNLMDLRGRLMAAAPGAAEEIDDVVAALSVVIGDIRSYVMNLPVVRADGEVSVLLTDLVDEIREQSSIAVVAEIATQLPSLTDEQRLVVFHVAQEALGNVRRHAGARHVIVRVMHRVPDTLVLEVQDDGSGFEPSADSGREHMGLRNMRTRAEQAGGHMEVESAPGAGTLVRLVLPVPGTAA